MSNLETVQGFYAGAAKGDMDAIRSILAPRVHWQQMRGWPNGTTLHTPDEVIEGVFVRLGGEWDGFRGVPEEFIDAGERVIVLGTYAGTSKATGRSFEAGFAHVFTVQDGKITTLLQYADTALVQDAWRDR